MRHENQSANSASETRVPLMDRIKFFLWWCAGADVTTLKACPTDHTRYTALGMMVLAIPCVASVSFAFFLTQTFGLTSLQAIAIGCAWGCVVFLLDRLVLCFHRKGHREFVRALPRLVLAVSIAFVIGDPLLTRLFQGEIELELIQKGQTVLTDARQKAEARSQGEKEALHNSNADFQKRLDDLKRLQDEKEAAVIGEIEGRVGSGIKGEGLAARQKKEAFAEAKAAYEKARGELLPQMTENNKRLDQIQSAIDEEVKRVGESHSAAKGIMARHQALWSIIKREPSSALTYVPLFLILGLLEVTPIVNKLAFAASAYDMELALRERNAIAQAERQAAEEREKNKRLIAVRNKVRREIADAVIKNDLASLVQPKREVGELLQHTILYAYRGEILSEFGHPNGHRKFDREIAIEIANRADIRARLELPEQARAGITLAELHGDVERIAAELSENGAAPVELVRAASSKSREVYCDLPLLPQLETDQILRLTFAPTGDSNSEPPIA